MEHDGQILQLHLGFTFFKAISSREGVKLELVSVSVIQPGQSLDQDVEAFLLDQSTRKTKDQFVAISAYLTHLVAALVILVVGQVRNTAEDD